MWKRILATLAIAVCGFGQSGERPRFDVASIKPNPSPALRHVVLPPLGGRLSTNRAPLRLLIETAYDVQTFQIQGGPEWMNSQGWDVEAKAEGDPERSQIWRMLQSMLEDRFQLNVHRETKEFAVYRLVRGKRGFLRPKQEEGACGRCGDLNIAAENGTLYLQGRQVGMEELSRTLSTILMVPILDQTGVTEKFDLTMPFAFDDLTVGIGNPQRPGDPSDPAGVPSIGVALQQKLGLRLEKGEDRWRCW
jgi:uncharacterized protein (TIGR03435 family)